MWNKSSIFKYITTGKPISACMQMFTGCLQVTQTSLSNMPLSLLISNKTIPTKRFLETFYSSRLSIVATSSCGFVSGPSIHFWPATAQQAGVVHSVMNSTSARHFVMFLLWFKEHKQHLSYGHTHTSVYPWDPQPLRPNEYNSVHVVSRCSDTAIWRAQILHNQSGIELRK